MMTYRYKGFLIMARPYQIAVTGLWTVDLEIRRNGRRQAFTIGHHCDTEIDAEASCASLARRIIDGKVVGSSVEHLRERLEGPSHRRRPAPAHIAASSSGLYWLGWLAIPLALGLMGFSAEINRQQVPDWLVLGIAGVSGLLAIVVAALRMRRISR